MSLLFQYIIFVPFYILLVLLFSSSAYAANVRITEFVYNAEGSDKGKEYIEIINLGPDLVDSTSLRLVEGERSHRIHKGIGDVILKPGIIAVIVDDVDEFKSNYSYRGTILDSSFLLSNSESTLKILLNDNVIHSVRYSNSDGANGDGNALTVSENNRISSSSTSIGSVSSGIRSLVVTGSTSTSQITITKGVNRANKKNTQKVSDDNSVINNDVENDNGKYIFITDPNIIFSASTTNFSIIEKDNQDRFLYGLWNFGDGSILYGDKVKYQYLYPGKYIISFESIDLNSSNESISFQEAVTVIYPNISIERMDGSFIRFVNNHSFILDISGWKILSGVNIFEFPNNTFILSKSGISVPFSSDVKNPIFFITDGGGQFLGYQNPEPVELVKDGSIGVDNGVGGGIESNTENNNSAEVEGKVSITSNHSDNNNSEFIKEKSLEEIDNNNSEFIKEKSLEEIDNIQSDQLRENKINSEYDKNKKKVMQERNRIILIWAAMFLGLLALVLAPLFIAEVESKKKNVKRRIRKIKK